MNQPITPRSSALKRTSTSGVTNEVQSAAAPRSASSINLASIANETAAPVSARETTREETLMNLNRFLEREIRLLQLEVKNLNLKVADMQEGGTFLGWMVTYQFYTRRMAILANFMLGCWIFWQRIMSYLRKARPRIFQAVMHTGKNPESTRQIIVEAVLHGMKGSWLFIIGSMMMSQRNKYVSLVGVGITTFWSIFLAIIVKKSRWTNYANTLANIMYIWLMYLPQNVNPLLIDLIY